MIRNIIKYTFFTGLLLLLLSSCGASKGSAVLYNPTEVAQLSRELGVKLSNTDKEDDKNIPLYVEVSKWMGTPYRHGGTTKKGVDCSGFTQHVFKSVYRIKLPRSTSGLAKAKYKTVPKGGLQTGDLMFFATSKSKKVISHVGIYLKDGYFAHASTSRGVIVSNIEESYYKKAWRKGARVK